MVDAILTADWHIRDDIPKCRTDNFFQAQEKKIVFVFKLAKKYKCPILISGDLGERPSWSCKLLEWFTSKVKKNGIEIYCTIGQHDTLYHCIKNYRRSGIGVLGTSGTINLLGKKHHLPIDTGRFIIVPFPFGYPIKKLPLEKFDLQNKPIIAMTHEMVLKNKPLWPGGNEVQGVHLLKKFPMYDLILSGDNHNPFVSRYKDRLLVNPGSMTRHKADQVKHRPRVYLWYAEENKVRRMYIPIEKGVISREHIKKKEKRTKKMDEYIEKMETGYNKSASYKDNLEKHFRKNRVKKTVQERVLESCHQNLKN